LAVVAAAIAGLAWSSGLISFGTGDSLTRRGAVTSDLLGRDMPYEAFVPRPSNCSEPSLLLLFHGRGGDERQWMEGDFGQGVGIDSVASRLIDEGAIRPVTIVSALIDDSYGVDSDAAQDGYDHGPYQRYILDELLPQLRTQLGLSATTPVALGGLSMGGFVALNTALSFPGEVWAVAALSPAFFVSPPADRRWIYEADGQSSIFQLVDEGAADGKTLFLGYGGADYDWIRRATSELGNMVVTRGLAAAPMTVPGGHEVRTWRALAEPMLKALYGAGGQGSCPSPGTPTP